MKPNKKSSINGDVSAISGTEQEQNQESGLLTENIEEQANYICDICGKSFDNAVSLEHHKLRSHRIPKEKREKGEGGKSSKSYAGLEETKIPDPLQQLGNMLSAFGLSSRDVDACLTYMRNYDVNNLFELKRCLESLGMPRNRLILFLKSWASARDIALSRVELRKLGIIEDRKGFYDDYSWNFEDEESYYSRKPSKFSEVREMFEAFSTLLDKFNKTNNSNPETSYLKAKIEKLEKQLEEQKYKTLEAKIDSLKEEVENQKKVGSSQWDLLRDIVQHTHETVLRVADAILPKREASPPSERKVVSESEIPRYLQEMGGEQYLE